MKKKTKNNKVVSCLCGSIKFKANDFLRHVINCHCKHCMKTHGNFGAYTSLKEKNITYLSKKNLKWYKSSKKAKRGFCNICGASIFFKRLGSKNISVSAGMLQNPTKIKTKENIFTKGKLDYYTLDKNLPKYDKYHK